MHPDSTSRDRRLAFLGGVFPAAIYIGCIFYTGLIRIAPLPEVGFVPTDKLLHALVFAGLALLLVRAERVVLPQTSPGRRLLLALLLASLVGELLEICQSFVPYRSAEFLDWLADTLGALGAVGLFGLFMQLVSRRAHG